MPALTSSLGFNRKSVQTALRAIDHALKNIRVPKNGLVIFASDIELELIEPQCPAQKSIYLCDSTFHREFLEELKPEHNVTIGNILIITGNGFGIYSVSLNGQLSTLYQEKVDLANQHSRGGQSAKRFERLAEESRQNYIRKVAEYLNTNSIGPFIIAGSASLKHDLASSDILHATIRDNICRVVTISSDFLDGAKEALPNCKHALLERNIQQSLEILNRFYRDLSHRADLWVFGHDLDRALEMNLIEYLIVHEHHPLNSHKLARVIKAGPEASEIFSRDYGGVVGKLYWPADLSSEKEDA